MMYSHGILVYVLPFKKLQWLEGMPVCMGLHAACSADCVHVLLRHVSCGF